MAPKPIENDCQPEVLPDEILEINHPRSIPLMYSKEKLKCRKVPAILRFHSPNKDKDFELYAHHLLFLFYPFRSEIELKIGEPLSYTNKLAQPGVLEIANNNKTRIEPFDDIVNEALIRYNVNNLNNLDPYAQAENDDTLSLLTPQCSGRDENNVSGFSAPVPVDTMYLHDDDIGVPVPVDTIYLHDDDIGVLIRSLNHKQRQVFDYIYHWARNVVKHRFSIVPNKLQSFHLFLTGGSGCGKSHLIKTVYQSVSKLLLYRGERPDKPRVLLLAPTGDSSININGTTLHSALGLPCQGPLYPLNNNILDSLRNKLSEVELIVIDGISMVSQKGFFQVHQRIFGVQLPFAGKSVLVCGDLYQLPPLSPLPPRLAIKLSLKLETRVMLTVNVDIADRLTNGQMGIIKHFKQNEQDRVITIYVKFDDSDAGKKMSSSNNLAKQNCWVPITATDTKIKIKPRTINSPTIQRTQFPLMLSWACTVHKVQGLSLQTAVISFDLNKQRAFNAGQMYVALSRVTSMEDLFLKGSYSRDTISVSTCATEEYDRVHQNSPFIPLEKVETFENCFVFGLFNTRSLKKHAIDMASDENVLENDVIFLTETQLHPHTEVSCNKTKLEMFNFNFNSSDFKFSSLAIGYKDSVQILDHEKHCGIPYLPFASNLCQIDC